MNANFRNTVSKRDLEHPDSVPASSSLGSHASSQNQGEWNLHEAPDASGLQTAVKRVEQLLQDQDFFLSELQPSRFELLEPSPQPRSSREQDSGDEQQGELVLSVQESSCSDLITAAERLEKLARYMRHQAATIVDRTRHQTGRAGQLPGTFLKQKPARRRVRTQELLNTRQVPDAQSPTTSPVVVGYERSADPAQRVMSPTASLDGIYSKFLEVYLPRNRKGDTATAVLSLLIATPDALPSPVHALDEAIHTLVLVSLGGATGDHALLQQGVQHYGKALSSLRKWVGRPQVTHYEHTFVAIMILLMCSHHTAIRTVDNGWVQHMWGAQQYFLARNSRAFKTKVGGLALALARHASLSYSLLARKASIFAKSTKSGTAPDGSPTNWSDLLSNTALEIPALLERHDTIMLSGHADPKRIEMLDAACLDVEHRLRAWLKEWTTVYDTIGIILFKERSVDQFFAFCNLCKDRTFKLAYEFQDFSYAFLAIWYCISMLYIIQTRISLEAHRQGAVKGVAPRIDIKAYRAEALRFARSICMCVPFLCEEQCGMSGYIAMLLPLRVATAYFQRYGPSECLQWTDEVRKTVFVKGISPPNATYQRRT